MARVKIVLLLLVFVLSFANCFQVPWQVSKDLHFGPIANLGPSSVHASSPETLQGKIRYRIRSPGAYAAGFGAALVLGTYGTYELLSQYPELFQQNTDAGDPSGPGQGETASFNYAEMGIIGYYDATITFTLEEKADNVWQLERGTVQWFGYNLCELKSDFTNQIIGLELSRPLQLILSDSFGDSGSQALDPARDRIDLRITQGSGATVTFESLEYELDVEISPPYTVSGKSEFIPYFPKLTFSIEATDGKVVIKSPWHATDGPDLPKEFSINHSIRDRWVNRKNHIETWQGLWGTQVVVETTIDYSCSARIVSPSPDEALTFDTSTPGVLNFVAEARTSTDTWSDALDSLVWSFPEIEGSNLTTDPEDRRGPRVEVTYTGLPEDNHQFGEKEISARFESETLCSDPPPVKVRIFFPRDASNHPDSDGSVPNWFYYWKQTSAGLGLGDAIVYDGEHRNAKHPDKVTLGYYNGYVVDDPGHPDTRSIYVCDLSFTGFASSWLFNRRITRQGIDTFATTVLHEMTHMRNYLEWWAPGGGYYSQRDESDRDKDFVPDALEAQLGLNRRRKDTHRIGQDDEEYLAYRSERNWIIGSANHEDWANPGKQSGGGN